MESSKEETLPNIENEVYDDEKITWTCIDSCCSCGCHNGNGWLSKARCEYLKKDYKASVICALIAFMVANAIYDLLPVSNGLVITAGVLACVGLSFLLPDKESNK